MKVFKIEDEFVEYNSDKLMEGIAELGFPGITKYRPYITKAIYYIVDKYVEFFISEDLLETRKKKLLSASSDIILLIIGFFIALCSNVDATGKARILGHGLDIFFIVLVLIVLVFLFYTIKLSLK